MYTDPNIRPGQREKLERAIDDEDDRWLTVKLPLDVYNLLDAYKHNHCLKSMWKAVDIAVQIAVLYEAELEEAAMRRFALSVTGRSS